MPNQIYQFVVNEHAAGLEEGGAGRELVDSEDFLLLSNSSVISFCCFFHSMNIFVHLGLRWESDTVNPLQRVILNLTEPVGGGVFGNFESLYDFGRWNMRSSTQVD